MRDALTNCMLGLRLARLVRGKGESAAGQARANWQMAENRGGLPFPIRLSHATHQPGSSGYASKVFRKPASHDPIDPLRAIPRSTSIMHSERPPELFDHTHKLSNKAFEDGIELQT